MRILRMPDANSEGASSNPSAAASEAAGQDAQAASSAEQAAAEAPGESLDAILKKGFDEAIAKEGESPTPEEAEASRIQQLNETGREKSEAVEEGQEKPSAEKEPDEAAEEQHDDPSKPVPYERFQQVIQERNEVREQMRDIQPKAELHDRLVKFCQDNQLTDDDYVQAMEIAALLKNDPQQAWEKLKPIVEGLGVLSGDKLPDDLAKDVEEGALTMERAKEIATLRAQTKFREKSQQVSEKQRADRQKAAFVQSIHTAWASWDANKRKLDPDFKPGGNGLWELVNDRMAALGAALGPNGQPVHPIRSPEDAIKLAEEAYKFVMKTAKKITPLPGARRALSSNGSGKATTKAPVDAATFEEAIKQRAQELGVV